MKLRILIVDDEAWQMRSLMACLRDADVDVDEAHDMRSGCRKVKHMKYDALVIDCLMPSMDKEIPSSFAGGELVRRIRNGHKTVGELNKGTIVIALTGVATKDVLADLEEAGVHSILRKPITLEDLLQVLRGALDERSARDSQPSSNKGGT